MKKIPFEPKNIINQLEKNGFEAYIVGGCVRDMLLGFEPHDYDITTNALPEDIKRIFEKTADTGIKHGTVTVIVNGIPFEVTTFRSDGDYVDMRHPENVKFVTDIKEDLARRDFTVNAMAYNDNKGIVDCFGGIKDLKRGVLRAVGEPEKRFGEDALRIMRLVRFCSTLGFSPEKKTLAAAKKLCKNLENVSAERIWSELEKLLNGKNPDTVRQITAIGGLKTFGIYGNKRLTKIAELPVKTELRFFCFCKILNLDINEVIKHLKIKNRIKLYCEKCEKIMFLNKKSNDFDIKTALDIAGVEVTSDIIEYKSLIEKTDMSATKEKIERIISAAEPYKIAHLKIKGSDLSLLGYKEKEIGKELEKLCEDVKRNPDINTKENLINLANKRN